ncbi:MAG: acyl carrier protein [Deinococcales bacterium]
MKRTYDDLGLQIKTLISDETGIDVDEIDNNTALLSSGLVDSFAFVAVLSLIEFEYGIEFSPSELTIENFDTIDSIIELTKQKGGVF